MGKKSVPQTKGDIHACFMEIVDPPLKDAEKDKIWAHFESKCAYCGIKLERAKRNGQMDHVISQKKDNGLNHVSNRVLACGNCNGDDKRETDWQEFIRFLGKRESWTQEQVEGQIKKIEDWIVENSPAEVARSRLIRMRSLARPYYASVCEALETNVSAFETEIEAYRNGSSDSTT